MQLNKTNTKANTYIRNQLKKSRYNIINFKYFVDN